LPVIRGDGPDRYLHARNLPWLSDAVSRSHPSPFEIGRSWAARLLDSGSLQGCGDVRLYPYRDAIWSVRLLFSPPVPCMASQSSSAHIGNLRPIQSADFSAIYAASGHHPPKISFSDDFLEMTCIGIRLDYIDGLGGVHEVRREPEDLIQSTAPGNIPLPGKVVVPHDTTALDIRNRCSLLMDAISRCLVLDRKDRYLQYPAPRDKFSREFRILCQAAVRSSEGVHGTFADWFNRNQSLLIRGRTLKESVLQGGDSAKSDGILSKLRVGPQMH